MEAAIGINVKPFLKGSSELRLTLKSNRLFQNLNICQVFFIFLGSLLF